MKLISFLGRTDRLDEDAKAMYNQMLAKVITPQNRERLLADLAWAKKTLRRPHRITWYLRYRRLAALTDLVAVDQTGAAKAQYDKEAADLAARAGVSVYEIANGVATVTSRQFTTAIEHFMSMIDKIPEIDKIPFLYQLPYQLLAQMKEIEDEWVLTRDAKVDPTEEDPRYSSDSDRSRNYHYERDRDGAEKLIDFGDGFAWWNLGVASCSAEGEAMGHCGNSTRSGSTDRILSLRKRSTTSEGSFDTPFCTFILDDNGYIGEMKGRGNKKPAARYHPYIIALLKLDLINGIKGGGYLPHENFSLNDLPEETQEELKQINPNLRTLDEIFTKDGPTEDFWNRLWRMSSSNNIGGPYPISKSRELAEPSENATPEERQKYQREYFWSTHLELESWEDIEQYANSNYDEDLQKAVELLDSEAFEENLVDNYEVNEDDALKVLQELPTEYVEPILRDLGIRPGRSALARAALQIQQSKFAEPLKTAIIKVAAGQPGPGGTLDRKGIFDVIETIMHMIRFTVQEVGLNWDKTENAPVTLVIRLGDFIGYAERSGGDDEDNGWALRAIQHEGWDHVDDDSSYDREDILKDKNSRYHDSDQREALMIARGLSPVPTMSGSLDHEEDPRQSELDVGLRRSGAKEYDPDAPSRVNFNPKEAARAFMQVVHDMIGFRK